MIKLERIHEDEHGAWPLDDYFDYIDSVADALPVELRRFATTIESYELQGKYTLHDSRMISMQIAKERTVDGVSKLASVDITFLDQRFEGEFSLHYGGVSAFEVAESGLLDSRGSDVLLHEVSVVSDGVYKHAVMFDGDGGYIVEFRTFERKLDLLKG